MSHRREALLSSLGFVLIEGGAVRLGTDRPLPCRLEGHRHNETPAREVMVGPFWLARCCVSNAEFGRFQPRYVRPLTGLRDCQPVTDVTYLEAVNYAAWFSVRHGLEFTLPTEAQWTFAAAPFGLEFPWGTEPDRTRALTRGTGITGPFDVDDRTFGESRHGLLHIVGNVQQIMLGVRYASGTDGAASDGPYCIVKGGDWRHCAFSVGVARRGLLDVAARAPTVGFRLVVNET